MSCTGDLEITVAKHLPIGIHMYKEIQYLNHVLQVQTKELFVINSEWPFWSHSEFSPLRQNKSQAKSNFFKLRDYS